ncbi:hypothetical protein J6TS2_38110 [Heyndrickxia sporothermodurans]|nr:hypothetical protein J6TS2_38110 [Heyndrickxia sporothermodurans]
MKSNQIEQNETNLYKLVMEIRETTYSMDALLLKKYNELIDNDLTTKQVMIMDLVYKESGLTVTQLAKLMKISSSAVSQIVSKLEKKKYLSRTINLENRREIIVQLDEKGHDYYTREEKMNEEIVKRFYSQLNFQEVIQLRDIIKKLHNIVEKELNTMEDENEKK